MATTLTGNAGQMSLGGSPLTITKWSGTLKAELADSTDSSSFNATLGYTFKTQKPGVRSMEGSVEGNFDLDQTSASIAQKLFDGGPLPAVFKFTNTTTFASCDVDLSDVEISVQVPGANMVTYSAKYQSNGTVTIA